MAKDDESLTAQVLNMVLENNAIRERIYPLLIVYVVFNVISLAILLYIAIRVSYR
jgi:hypothetical protein